ncbi:phosphatidylethanolamine-binding protein, partial [Lasiosphaeria miniovina]
VALVAAAAVSMARTPDGFQPGSTTDLIVDYNGITALNGAVISKEATANQPLIGTTTRLLGSSYAVLMIDLDIPTNTPPATNTLAHWIQTGLTPATAATTLNTTRGTIQAFLLENKGNTAAIAPYFGPSPPARIPLSHRYTQILVDTSSITAQGLQTLSTAVNASRVGFNAGTVLAQANLAGKVVAGNFYNVTNPGPVQA